jgi:exopolyphosphatase/pppGpp-phosphohydrolase
MDASSQPNHCERFALAWTRRRLGSLRHERRVLAAADAIFRLLQPLHRLEEADRRLLRLAAIVHDVGRCVNAATHAQVGAGILLADESLPLTPRQRRALAYLTRYHRGAVPESGFEEILRPGDERPTLRVLLAILRAADALDGRQLGQSPPRIALKLRGRKLKIRVTLEQESRRVRKYFSRRKKFRTLQRELGVEVCVALRVATIAC